MKKILITGANSYIGTSFENWLRRWPNEYSVDVIDTIDVSWKSKDFSVFDVVFHVAGIAHRKETKKNSDFYYKINRDLAIEVARKAKIDGVKQFVFLSSMSVYGMTDGIINMATIPKPKSNYGKSKLEAEELMKSIEGKDFKIAILRPPIVYGEGCKGNYQSLVKIALKSPVFPNIKNKRSMIYIENLCEVVRKIIDNLAEGLFLPQNEEYVCTSEIVKLIAKVNNKKICMTKIFNPFLKIFKVEIVKKVFGDLVYEKNASTLKGLDLIAFSSTIKKEN